MKSEGDMPAGVTKVVEGTPFCPNCDVPMKPVASVDTTSRPNPGLSEGLSLAERLAKLRVAEQEVAEAESEWDDAKDDASKAKKVFDGKVETLRTLIRSLTSVAGPTEPKPILDLAEQEPEPPADGEILVDDSVMAAAVAAAAEALRVRLANLHIVVDVPEIEGWTLEQYDAVIPYVTKLESGAPIDDSERPPFLSIDVPTHITALHSSLCRVGLIIGLGEICAWTPEQREQAATWAAAEAESPGSSDRPEYVPGPPADEPRQPRRKSARKQEPVHA